MIFNNWLVILMVQRLGEVEKRLREAESTLHDLEVEHGHTSAYFSEQWEAQRKTQLDTISVTAARQRERMVVLLELEEKLTEARYNKFHLLFY